MHTLDLTDFYEKNEKGFALGAISMRCELDFVQQARFKSYRMQTGLQS